MYIFSRRTRLACNPVKDSGSQLFQLEESSSREGETWATNSHCYIIAGAVLDKNYSSEEIRNFKREFNHRAVPLFSFFPSDFENTCLSLMHLLHFNVLNNLSYLSKLFQKRLSLTTMARIFGSVSFESLGRSNVA